MTPNYIQEVPNSFSIYVRRRGQYLIDAHGTIIATIDFPVYFSNLEEGAEVEMKFLPRIPDLTAVADANETEKA